MSSEWPVLPLEECLDALIDYRGKTPDKTDSGIPLITAKIIKAGRIETPTEFIAVDNYDAWMRRGIPRAGDVVLTVEAPLGEVAQLGKEKVALAQRVVTLRGKKGLLDSTYLLYLLQSEELQVGCCRFQRHLVKVEDETGGGSWEREGNSAESSSLKQSSW